jgi:hypothetical protein
VPGVHFFRKLSLELLHACDRSESLKALDIQTKRGKGKLKYKERLGSRYLTRTAKTLCKFGLAGAVSVRVNELLMIRTC